jgi:hypothetical protein
MPQTAAGIKNNLLCPWRKGQSAAFWFMGQSCDVSRHEITPGAEDLAVTLKEAGSQARVLSRRAAQSGSDS